MKNNLLKVYIGECIKDLEYLEILNPNLGFKKRKNIFGDQDIFDNFLEPIVEVVANPEQAQFVLIPHNYFRIKDNKEYIESFTKLSKKIIVFAIGDSNEEITIPNSIILRTSQYKSLKKASEIILPAYAADLSYGKPIIFRSKKDKPTIGFCGWANTKDFLFYFKNLFLIGPYKQGLYFRKKAIEILNKSSIIKTNFIIRSSYGASEKTIKIDPKTSREEYRNNIIDSDFVLAPKGDGNFSVRFYETLSLGRIPILIDTDCSLPLEDKVDYSKFILRVYYKDIDRLDRIVADFYSKLSEEEWLNMQREAKKAFDQYLRVDVFFRQLFSYENPLFS